MNFEAERFEWACVCVCVVGGKNVRIRSYFRILILQTGIFFNSRVDSWDGSANADIDYRSVTGIILTFLPGDTIAGLLIEIIDDDLIEGAEQFSITLSIDGASPGLTIRQPSVMQITITDNDAAVPGK